MEIIEKIKSIRVSNPDNIMAKTIDLERLAALSPEDQVKVARIIRSGIDNADSQVGAYAMSPDDYRTFAWLLDPIVETYHKVPNTFRQTADWNLKGEFDLKSIDPSLGDISMRVRVARNTTEFPLPGSMTKEQRVAFEERMTQVFEPLIANPEFGGKYSSLTPGSSYEITEEEYQALIKAHKMFKNMDNDPYLNSAGISGDWPYGRGMYESQDGNLIVWVNEEDQLRIVSMSKGSDLSVVFKNLKRLLTAIEESGLTFAVSDKFGNVTSCPSNIGTGMRASVHVALPNLVQNEDQLKSIAKANGLSARGTGGEHTPYIDNIVDISPRGRLGVTEAQILRSLFDGIKQMLEAEASQPILA